MKKLIKWTLITTVVVGIAGFAAFGKDFPSYVGTGFSSVRDSLKESIPVEVEIKRAEKLIKAIDPEIKQCRLELARAKTELGYLNDDIDRLRKKVGKQERKLRAGQKLLQNAEQASYEMGSSTYSRRRVEMDLARTFETFKNNKAMLKSKEALVERQSRSVTASLVKLDAVRTRKAELENTIASLKVQKKHLDALAASSKKVDVDDTALGEATKVLAEVKKRLDVTQQMIEDDIFFAEGIREDAMPKRDILKEINQHFNGETESSPKSLSVRNAAPLDGR